MVTKGNKDSCFGSESCLFVSKQGVPSVPWLPRTASINTGTRTVLAEHHITKRNEGERGTMLIRLDGNCNAMLCNVFRLVPPRRSYMYDNC